MAKVNEIEVLRNDFGQVCIFFLNDLYHFEPVFHTVPCH